MHSQGLKKRFIVSFSYAGETRKYVEQVADSLSVSIGKDKIFYDKYYTAELARLNLDTYLHDIYRYDSELLVIFLNEDYAKKEWCGLEWRIVREIIKKKADDSIMPICLDSTRIDGLLSIDGYLDIKDLAPSEVASLIIDRVRLSGKLGSESKIDYIRNTRPRLPIRIVHGLPPAPRFVGRENELNRLRDFWNDSSTRIFGIEAIGGSGKTALSEYFLSEVISTNEFEGIFVWSFYDNSNPEYFFQELYEWLQPLSKNSDTKGYAWLNIVKDEFCNRGKILLILDGLEKNQFQIDSPYHAYGSFQDTLIKEFLKRVAAFGKETKTIITTRFPLSDLDNWKGRTYTGVTLSELDIISSIALLKSHQIIGTDEDFNEALLSFGTHALTIDHLGSVIKLFYEGNIKNHKKIDDLASFKSLPKAKKLQAIFKAYEENLPELEKNIICIVSLYRLGLDFSLIEQTYCKMHEESINELDIKLAIQNLLSSHLLLSDNKNYYTVHPAVRDYFYHIFKDPFQSHSSASQTLISLTNRPGGNKIVTDQSLLDQLEELVYHLIRAGSIDMAKDIYFNRIGGVWNLGYNLGDFSRLKRLLDEFPLIIDYDGLIEYQRALGLLPSVEEIEAIKSKLSHHVTHRFDSILLLLGELPRAVLREVSSAKYLMGYDCHVYPTYEAAPKFQVYCLRRNFPEHVRFSQVYKTVEKIKKISKADHWKYYSRIGTIVKKDDGDYYVEEDDNQQLFFENFGNRSVKFLFEAELLRKNNDFERAWRTLKSAETQITRSGSIEHLCLLHLVKSRLHLDRREIGNAEYEIFEGLELSGKSGYNILKIDFLNEQARFFLATFEQCKFEEIIKAALRLSIADSCRYFWGALRSADLLLNAKGIYPEIDLTCLKKDLSIFSDVFQTQTYSLIEFKRVKGFMGF